MRLLRSTEHNYLVEFSDKMSTFLRLSLHIKFPLSSIAGSRQIHMTNSLLELRKLARVRCVDNSAIGKQAMAEGRPPKIIHVYNKKAIATIGM